MKLPWIPTAILFMAAAAGAGPRDDSNRHGKIAGGMERLLYVTNNTGISIYDINDSHKLLRKIDVPDSGGYKGISASPQLGKLYVTSNRGDELIAIDLGTDAIVWRKKYGKYADSSAITPDGKRLYIPFREEDSWWIVNAADGAVLHKIPVAHGKNYDVDPIGNPVGPHNTWCNPAGSRMYGEVLTLPWVYIFDTATNKILGRVGPFSKGVRPFTVTNDEKYVFGNVDGLLGFEVAAAKNEKGGWGGKMLYRVEAKTPPERLAEVRNPPAHKPHSTPSHGINITPDQKEVWVVDGVYGYVYVYDVTRMPPKYVTGVALAKSPEEQPHPGWISFSIDGRYAYPDGGAVIDARTKQIAARIPTSEKLLEVDFRDGKPVQAGHR
jgi:DNA-binding beta-propeller fold protein YncE